MKAAVLHQAGTNPRYEDYVDPVPANEQQVLIQVKAASVKNIDKSRASGAHYGSYTHFPVVVGIDGVGALADGQLVYAMGITGMMADKALAEKSRLVALPVGIDVNVAAALPNIVIGAALALKYRAGMEPGKTVLINGATGVTGKAAVQLARHYGAKKVIATGRNPASLDKLVALGADEVIPLTGADEWIVNRVKDIHAQDTIDIVIDYLWGRPASLILEAIKGGGIHHISPVTKFVTVGGMAGDQISVSSGFLRSTAVELLGSGFGTLPREALEQFSRQILPEMMQLYIAGGLQIDTLAMPLADVEAAWQIPDNQGTRLVLVP